MTGSLCIFYVYKTIDGKTNTVCNYKLCPWISLKFTLNIEIVYVANLCLKSYKKTDTDRAQIEAQNVVRNVVHVGHRLEYSNGKSVNRIVRCSVVDKGFVSF